MTFCAFQINAQTNSFYIGAKTGATASEFRFTEDLKELYPNVKDMWGMTGGFDMGLQLDNWTISTGVLYTQKGSVYQTDNFEENGTTGYFTGEEKLHFLTVPVLLGYKQKISDNIGWSIAAGPSFNFGLGGKIDETTEYFGTDEVEFQNYKVAFGEGVNDDYKSTQVGFQINPSLFVELNERSKINFGITWDFGTSDMYNDRYKVANEFFDFFKGNQVHRNTMFTIGYEYHFNFEDKY
jgi:hypothetical protein